MFGGKNLAMRLKATDETKAAFNSVNRNMRQTQGLQRSMNANLNRNRRAVQQFGFQMGDFATQIAGGQSAMLAFTQQGGQMLQFFGATGAIAAAMLAVFGSLIIAFTRSGKALSELTPILGVLKDDFAAIGRVLVGMRELFYDFANVVVNNFDRILITGTLVASFFLVKFVASLSVVQRVLTGLRAAPALLSSTWISSFTAMNASTTRLMLRMLGFRAATSATAASTTVSMGAMSRGMFAAGAAVSILTTRLRGLAVSAYTAARGLTAVGVASRALSVVTATAVTGVRLLAGAFRFLRGALISTGIGALVVLVGELIYRFTQLVEGAGGVGAAFQLLAAVAIEVWQRIVMGAQYVWYSIKAAFENMGKAVGGWSTRSSRSMKAFSLEAGANILKLVGHTLKAFSNMLTPVKGFVNRAIGIHVGMFNAIRAGWSLFPQILQYFANMALNGLIDVMKNVFEALVGPINGVLEALGKEPIGSGILGTLEGLKREAGDAGGALETMSAAFNQGFDRDFVGEMGQLGEDMDATAAGMEAVAMGLRGLNALPSIDITSDAERQANQLAEELGKPLQSLDALREAMSNVNQEGKGIDVREWFGGAGAEVGGGSGGSGGSGGGSGGKSAAEKVSEQAKKIKAIYQDMTTTISGQLSEAFKGVVNGTKSFKDAAIDALVAVANKITEIMMQPIWDKLAMLASNALIGTPNGSGSFAGGALSNLLNNLFSFEGGGYTGRGSRVGGIDGRGGGLAILHPNESVIDHTKGGGGGSGGGHLEVHIHENAADGQHMVQQSPGRVDVMLKKSFAGGLMNGDFDAAMGQRYGLRAKPQGM